jgi:hypothetical protein
VQLLQCFAVAVSTGRKESLKSKKVWREQERANPGSMESGASSWRDRCAEARVCEESSETDCDGEQALQLTRAHAEPGETDATLEACRGEAPGGLAVVVVNTLESDGFSGDSGEARVFGNSGIRRYS